MGEPAAFDPCDPSDAMAESFRRQVLAMALEANEVAIFRDLTPFDQIASLLSGIATGMVCVAFSMVRDESRDEIMKYIGLCVEHARLQAEHMLLPPQEKA